MTLTLHLPPQLEETVKRRAADAGMDVESFVIAALKSKVVLDTKNDLNPGTTWKEFEAGLDEIIASQPLPRGRVDDSRESIYD